MDGRTTDAWFYQCQTRSPVSRLELAAFISREDREGDKGRMVFSSRPARDIFFAGVTLDFELWTLGFIFCRP
jgi:hypothetical protein